MTERGRQALYTGAVLGLLLLAAALRLYDLEPKPLHHDESLHAFFSWRLFETGRYAYDPMLHGPLLYYQIALAYRLFGVSDATARIAPALAGIGLVGLLPSLRPQLGRRGALVAIALATTSPLLVYVSRFARHDMGSLLCTLLLIVCTVRYRSERRSRYLYGAALALALSYVNHELTYITAAVWAVSVLFAVRTSPEPSAIWRSLARKGPHLLVAGTGATVLVLVLYSSLYSNPSGVFRALPNPLDPGTALGYWVVQHGVHRAGQPPYYYLLLLSLYELVPLTLGSVGALVGLRSGDGGWRFVSCFALLTLVAYSIAGERMPWLTVHSLLPLVLSASFLVAHRERLRPTKRNAVAAFGAAVLTGFALFNAVRLAFWNPANPIEMAVYTQSQPELKRTLQQVAHRYRGSVVCVDERLSWPTAWYLRDVPRANFVKNPIPATVNLAFVGPHDGSSFGGELPQSSPFNRWWTPPSGWPGISDLLSYYLYRRIWGHVGETGYQIKIDAGARR